MNEQMLKKCAELQKQIDEIFNKLENIKKENIKKMNIKKENIKNMNAQNKNKKSGVRRKKNKSDKKQEPWRY